ncbi:MAG TPA: exopolysaccharide biosynthesis polyprenyl glycosylphosphotransferase, partial [Actinomycetota bacterium]|nr:exopolysaccharide biosynthesis polyprenyl glycosylphosphotransferase [Actinomycetota bacterium]
VGSLGGDRAKGQPPLLGGVDDLEGVVRAYGIRRVVVGFGRTRDPDLVRILRRCDDLPVEVYVVPRLFELGAASAGRNVERVWGFPLVHLPRPARRRAARVCKRALDVVIASVVLVLLAPVFAAAAVAVKVSSPGPVLFRQERVGRRGRVFDILKFRTMVCDGDAETAWFVSGDERVTRVGRVLRKLSLDELPQLINVLRGEMSLVGPRPERPHYVDRFSASIPSYEARHRVAVGITGWAQIHGRDRSMDAIPERARFDNDYIENWSVWQDLLILVRTVPHVFRGDVENGHHPAGPADGTPS